MDHQLTHVHSFLLVFPSQRANDKRERKNLKKNPSKSIQHTHPLNHAKMASTHWHGLHDLIEETVLLCFGQEGIPPIRTVVLPPQRRIIPNLLLPRSFLRRQSSICPTRRLRKETPRALTLGLSKRSQILLATKPPKKSPVMSQCKRTIFRRPSTTTSHLRPRLTMRNNSNFPNPGPQTIPQ